MKAFRLILCLPLFLLLHCRENKAENVISENESKLIISKSLEYILAKRLLPMAYYNKPILIANTNGRFKPGSKIHVNGFDCIILSKNANINKIIKGVDIYNPVPLVEIISLNKKGKYFYADLIFRSTGHSFLLELEKKGIENYFIKTAKEQTI